MSNLAIRTEGLGKRYPLGRRRGQTDLREALTDAMRASFSTLASRRNGSSGIAGDRLSDRCIWALQDVSLDVKFGELIGIMGNNGGGKTTLLQVLSRITKPTVGYGEIHGRVGTLLDLGAGLHGELTGRENVYLNGAVKGMSRFDVRRKFDEIVAFAELDRFINTPLKHYSSGMCVRLVFAVAVHLEFEILLVDEVLAHADSTFQTNCSAKLTQAANEGRTVLLVSHDCEYIRRLCTRGIVFVGGRLACDNRASEAVEYYDSISSSKQLESLELAHAGDR